MNSLDQKIFQRFEKTSRADTIYEIIKDGILQGVWKPGDKIDDQELAKRLGVSRLSVREALSKFVENLIIEKQHWKGYQVRQLQWKEIEGIMEIRIALETIAIDHVARNITPELIKELEGTLNQAVRDMEAEDHTAFRLSDYAFHEIIHRECGNIWITNIISNIRVLIEIIRRISQEEHFRNVAWASIEEHRAVLDCLKNRDPQCAVETLRSHLLMYTERVRAEYKHPDSLQKTDD
ncbi:GntR family transcriptional regulator [Marispirochaeta sp.]|jgi:DNA-binding GntR family transcriptional regulator|uniref:GntR family transcriptional regulator n=1 Tax=Marispirochaeta sp. TaxID=2038653 RepID=UPI0029C930D8|nr:GntR family transcriptional regulator [Marispirochaeta sp.]